VLDKLSIIIFVFRFCVSISLLGLLLVFYLPNFNDLLINLMDMYKKSEIDVSANGSDFIFIYVAGQSDQIPVYFNSMRIHFGPVLMLSLFLGSPYLTFASRLRYLILVVCFGFITQILGLFFIQTLMFQAWEGDWSENSSNSFMALFTIVWLLIPGLLGGIWCYLCWLPKARLKKN